MRTNILLKWGIILSIVPTYIANIYLNNMYLTIYFMVSVIFLIAILLAAENEHQPLEIKVYR